MRKLIQAQLKRQYERTMRDAYAFARHCAVQGEPTRVLDCGAGSGHESDASFGILANNPGFVYKGLEWSRHAVDAGRASGLDVVEADLNKTLPVESDSIDCAIAYSVVEHLLMPCAFMSECHRVLRPGGRLVLLTPNISTWFTALQVISGRMPSSGPHPDSNWLIEEEAPVRVSSVTRDDVSADTPQHRHLVVFSRRTLGKFLEALGFSIESNRGFGYYPLPRAVQRLMERVDPTHCHQLVVVATKRREPGRTGA